MGATIIVIAGLATALNFISILYKFQEGNPINGTVDVVVLATMMYLFSNSTAALVIATIASAIFSIYLIFKPIDPSMFDDD